MSTVKIIHTADLHLGSARTGVKNGKIEIENTFLKIISLCEAENIDFLLIAGDLFDSPFPDANDAEKIIAAMGRIPNTVIAITPGNHDPACPGSVYLKYKFPENVVVFQSFGEYIDFPEKGVRLFGAGFTDRFERISLMNGFEAPSSDLINICVLHGDITADGGTSEYNPITLGQIEGLGFDYLALGHIHKRSEIQRLGKTYFAYSGCPDGMGFDEPGGCGLYAGEIGNGICRLEYRELSSRQYIITSADIGGCCNSFDAAAKVLEYIKNGYGESYARNLYRIKLVGTVSADTVIDAVQVQAILGDELEYIRVSDCTAADISDISEIASETSLRGIFVKKMLARINSSDKDARETYKNALRLGLRAFNKGVKLGDN